MTLKLYIDWASQPSRAVVAYCRLNGIPHEVIETRIQKGENQLPEYLAKVNSEGQVPAIVDGDFCLAESHAILRYLHDSRGKEDHWYPKELKKRAQVDRYLDWHHTHLRQAGALVFKTCFAAALTGKKHSAEELAQHEQILKKSLTSMDKWLTAHKYLCGEQVTIADLAACHELDQTCFLEYDLTPWPKVKQWLHHMIDENKIQMEITALNRRFAKNWRKKNVPKAKL